MKAHAVTNVESFRALRGQWNDLLERSGHDTPCLRWEWMFSCYECLCLGQRLFLVLVEDDEGHLKGIAPFVLREERIVLRRVFLEFLGQRYSHHLGVIAHPDDQDAVCLAVCDYVFENRKQWNAVKLANASSDGMFRRRLRDCCGSNGYLRRERVSNPCKVVQLTGSFDEFLSSLEGQFRKKLRYSLGRLEREHRVELIMPKDEDTFSLIWNRFLELHQGAIKDKGSQTVLLDPRYQRFYRSVAHSAFLEGTLALVAMQLDGQIAAVKFAVVRNKTCFFLNSGYQRVPHFSLYLLSTVLCIKMLMERGIKRFDFMGGGGGGGYKEKLGGQPCDGLSIMCYPRIVFIETAGKRVFAIVSRTILRVARRCGIGGAIH
ncbi:MAG: GNAT family N-acetyltransferase [Pirellulales bacterium]|nr:GNAT family N-acetyltransferase [Pirellulales bacterium]